MTYEQSGRGSPWIIVLVVMANQSCAAVARADR